MHPTGVLECMPKKDLPRRSDLKLAQLIERVSPVVQTMEERLLRFFLLTRSQEDTKALLLTVSDATSPLQQGLRVIHS